MCRRAAGRWGGGPGPWRSETRSRGGEGRGGGGRWGGVARPTAKALEGGLGRGALGAPADEPVRVLATTNRRGQPLPQAPANAVVVEWLSYSQAMAVGDLVVCHGGDGAGARALGTGVPVICCPAVGDMAENGARVAWSGAGLMLPWRLTTPAALRLAVRKALGEPGYAVRAAEVGAWAAANDGAERGAELVEALAA